MIRHLLLPVLPTTLHALPTPRHTFHPDCLPIDLHWHLSNFSTILNEDMLHIVSYFLTIVHLLGSPKLSLSPLLHRSTLHRSCLSDHLSSHLIRRAPCPTSPVFRTHGLSNHARPRPTLDIPSLPRSPILVRLYCVLYDTLPARAATWPGRAWPGHVYWGHTHGLLHWATWPQLHRHHLGRSDYVSDWLLLAWPHPSTRSDHISKLLLLLLLLLLPDHNLPHIPLWLHQLELSPLLLWVLPHHSLPRLHHLHHLCASLPRGLPHCHKSLGGGARASGSWGHVVLGS